MKLIPFFVFLSFNPLIGIAKTISNSKPLIHLHELNYSAIERRTPISWLKAGDKNPIGESVGVNSSYWTKNNQPWLPVMGEFHYTRYPQSGWEEQLLKMKAAGISIISTYVFWINTEYPKGVWNWSGNNDLRYFISLCQKHGLYVWLRPGPYINAESRNGGLPDWINKNGKRSDASWYLAEVRNFYGQVALQTRGFFYKDGGPIIGLQLDNEYAYGDPRHLGTLLRIARELGMVAPINSCTNNSKYLYENGDILPLQGAYPYRGWGPLTPTTDYLFSSDEWNAMENIGGLPYDGNKFPRGMAELGVACWQGYGQRFVVPVYDSEAHLQNCIGRGVNLPGYYMFQGGTQREGTEAAGHPLTYDFQAPLGEYGQVRPSYHALKLIHHFLNDFGNQLAPMLPLRSDSMILNPADTTHLRFIGRFNDKNQGYLFLTNAQCWVDMRTQKSVQFKLNLPNDTIVFPQHPFDLKPNLAPIFPVNFDIMGTTIKYATAQLMCRVESNNVPYFFFFDVEGVPSEFSFANGTFSKLQTKSKLRRIKQSTVCTLKPGIDNMLTITTVGGKKAVVVLLTRKQAEQSWRMNFRGEERLILSDANLVLNNDSLEITTNTDVVHLSFFPALTKPLFTEVITPNTIFSNHVLSVRESKSQSISYHNTPSGVLFNMSRLPDGVNDVYLNIDYVGSTAELWVDGLKYSDNRNNGQLWSIGLKRFFNGQNHEFQIKINEWDSSVRGIPQSHYPLNDLEKQGTIRSAFFKNEYKIIVR